ncbi:glycosyltransferase [Flavobacterium bomense]|uniref:Glycosyltransferase n=1 Tax=Flavobacterium bomense TaxID=2497483 RepID=A0A432CI78_9FLAO|nr:glycosyltransferase [Flavobacterium bomense]RTZ02051.1 glycosyltransferase [Flavobacterium bomense]
MKKRILIIINARFPYEKSEDFLSNELDYAAGYDEIICFPILVFGKKSANDIIYKKSKRAFSCFNPISSYWESEKKIKLLFLVLTKKFVYEEIFFLLKNRKFSTGNIKNLFSFLLISYNAFYEAWDKINEIIKNNDVVIYSYWMHCSALAAISLKRKIKNTANVEKIITRCHRFDLYEYANESNYIPMRKHILSNMDEIHSISEDGLIYLEDKYAINKNKLILSRLGTIDRGVSIFPKSTTLHLVSCSWMRPVKRVSSIVRAISNLSFQLEWVHFGDGEEYNTIENLVKNIDNPLVSYKLMGAYSNEKVLDEYATTHYDVFINVSENEGVPVSIMEAMSFGKIIIATNVGGTSEIVENGINGFLLNKDFTNEELVSVITKVALLDEKQFSDMCNQSRRIWEERCNAENNYVQFYQNA